MLSIELNVQVSRFESRDETSDTRMLNSSVPLN